MSHGYDVAGSLAEARELLIVKGYAYVLLNCRLPARPGGTPRRQNAENFLDELTRIKGEAEPPVTVMFDPMPDVDEEDKIRWASEMTLRGVTTFIRKPFRAAGRTLDRVIKKMLAGQRECIWLVSVPVIPMTEQSEAPTPAGPLAPMPPAARKPEPHVEAGGPAAASQAEPLVLTKQQRDVLAALAESPCETMLAVEIGEAAGYSKPATRKHLTALVRLGLGHRPHGLRGGLAVTAKGSSFLADLAALEGGGTAVRTDEPGAAAKE